MMKNVDGEEGDEMPVKIAMVMARETTMPTEAAVIAAIESRWPDLPVVAGWLSDNSSTEESSAIFFNVDGQNVAAMAMPAPIPWADLEFPASQSFLWPDATQDLQTHDSHIVVSVISEAGGLEQARVLTQAMAGIIDATPGSLGVYQGDASLVVPAPLHQDLAAMLPETNPLFLWINFLVGVDGDRVYGFTAGMDSLGGLDVESNDSTDGPGEFRGRMHDLCAYVLEQEATINSGDTIGQVEDEWIRVLHGPSSFGLDRTVMQLHYTAD